MESFSVFDAESKTSQQHNYSCLKFSHGARLKKSTQHSETYPPTTRCSLFHGIWDKDYQAIRHNVIMNITHILLCKLLILRLIQRFLVNYYWIFVVLHLSVKYL